MAHMGSLCSQVGLSPEGNNHHSQTDVNTLQTTTVDPFSIISNGARMRGQSDLSVARTCPSNGPRHPPKTNSCGATRPRVVVTKGRSATPENPGLPPCDGKFPPRAHRNRLLVLANPPPCDSKSAPWCWRIHPLVTANLPPGAGESPPPLCRRIRPLMTANPPPCAGDESAPLCR
eukprot:590824-Prorocentrum_minimum.AAC.1